MGFVIGGENGGLGVGRKGWEVSMVDLVLFIIGVLKES